MSRTFNVLRSLAQAVVFTLTAFVALNSVAGNAEQENESDQNQALTVGSTDSEDLFKAQTFGWIEHVILSPELRWKLDAKLDTGADTSSLDAHDIRRVRYKGQSYVRFSIRNPESGQMVSLRRPYVRTVRIRRHSGNHQRRRVVLMTVCLGHSERTIEVTLTDREHFDYPMLLGRSALSGLAVVNPMATYTLEPECKSAFTGDEENVAISIDEPSPELKPKSELEKPVKIDEPKPEEQSTSEKKPAAHSGAGQDGQKVTSENRSIIHGSSEQGDYHVCA